jgi:hypothetical protein
LNANELIYLIHSLRGLRYMLHHAYAQQQLALWRWIPVFCMAAVKTCMRLQPQRIRLQK